MCSTFFMTHHSYTASAAVRGNLKFVQNRRGSTRWSSGEKTTRSTSWAPQPKLRFKLRLQEVKVNVYIFVKLIYIFNQWLVLMLWLIGVSFWLIELYSVLITHCRISIKDLDSVSNLCVGHWTSSGRSKDVYRCLRISVSNWAAPQKWSKRNMLYVVVIDETSRLPMDQYICNEVWVWCSR